MQLNLKNPLVFFDVETTGLDIAVDRIIEISLLKVMPGGAEEQKTFRVNPVIPISPSATAVHGITNADLAACPKFHEIAQTLANFMEGCDIVGYNSIKFDIPILAEEFLRADIKFDFRKRKLIDVQNIFHKMEQRTLSAAYKFYCDKELKDAHQAAADTYATYEILQSQLDRYATLENDVAKLSEFSAKIRTLDYAGRIALNEKDEAVINFGKYKGKLALEVLERDPGYYSWVMAGDFSLDTKRVFTELRLQSKTKNTLF
ncbi:MAG: 3'-5' exonuclease [Bacteroidales bacterium]|nr:3'-5' exonuclease [Bacteroidales bacterium]MCL2133774.1 3'-5' exonuclease [Bacteroidales bacterium]